MIVASLYPQSTVVIKGGISLLYQNLATISLVEGRTGYPVELSGKSIQGLNKPSGAGSSSIGRVLLLNSNELLSDYFGDGDRL